MLSTRRFYVAFLFSGLIFFGSTNSLLVKWQDMQCVKDCDSENPRFYTQPVLQVLQMCLGEMLCFIPILYRRIARQTASISLPAEPTDEALVTAKDALPRIRGWNIFLLWIPALFDLVGTTLMSIGLIYTPVSVYQMSRGALVLFVGTLSVAFLRRHLWLYQWVGLAGVTTGVGLVGYAGSVIDAQPPSAFLDLTKAELENHPTVLIGIIFTLAAQFFGASQYVSEESILSYYSVSPELAIACEGTFGVITIGSMCALMAALGPNAPMGINKYFQLSEGLRQTVSTPIILFAGIGTALSVALFNFCGLHITQKVSATARSLGDTSRTLAIWVFSLTVGWERLSWPVSLLQVLGFSVLVYGTFLFNGVVAPPQYLQPTSSPAIALPEDDAEVHDPGTMHVYDPTVAI